ncbi:hypothetical protein EMIT0324P_110041 [Pseudomonas chlororaphis]
MTVLSTTLSRRGHCWVSVGDSESFIEPCPTSLLAFKFPSVLRHSPSPYQGGYQLFNPNIFLIYFNQLKTHSCRRK